MIYVTATAFPKSSQLTFDDLLNGISKEQLNKDLKDTKNTITRVYEHIPERLREKVSVSHFVRNLMIFNHKWEHLISKEDKSSLYKHFKIPKRSGGMRQISAPCEQLHQALDELKYLLEREFFAKYHTSAFAYVKGRSTIDAIRRHQENNSRWFLKIDFHDFFGSLTEDFVHRELEKIFPFCLLYENTEHRDILKKTLSICFLNGSLPQGSPISPLLSNLVMLPTDYAIAKLARENSPHIKYTRYADDMIFSSDLNFETKIMRRLMTNIDLFDAISNLQNKTLDVFCVKFNDKPFVFETTEQKAKKLKEVYSKFEPEANNIYSIEPICVNNKNKNMILKQISRMIERDKQKTCFLSRLINLFQELNIPLKINDSKTRYGSFAGRNWNLGVMLNKDNQITIGHRKKKLFKATLFQFMTDYVNEQPWNLNDTQILNGQISYYKMVEKDNIENIIKHYSQKFNMDVMKTIKSIMTCNI